MTLKNNRAPLLSNMKLCASFHHHRWIQTGVTVRKRLNGVMTSVTLTFDLWPWPFAWTLRLPLVITPEISWWYDDGNIVKVWQTDVRTDRQADRKKCSKSCLVAAKKGVSQLPRLRARICSSPCQTRRTVVMSVERSVTKGQSSRLASAPDSQLQCNCLDCYVTTGT